MRATGIALLVAGAALTGGAVFGQSHQAADASPGSGLGEFRGQLHPDPETGCIEFRVDPGDRPRLSPSRAPGDEADRLPPPVSTVPEQRHGRGTQGEEWSDNDLELHRERWPVCEEHEPLLVYISPH